MSEHLACLRGAQPELVQLEAGVHAELEALEGAEALLATTPFGRRRAAASECSLLDFLAVADLDS
jgi:hypothetical protein